MVKKKIIKKRASPAKNKTTILKTKSISLKAPLPKATIPKQIVTQISRVPGLVKVIALLLFVYAGFSLFFGIALFISGLVNNDHSYYAKQLASKISSSSAHSTNAILYSMLTTSIVLTGIILTLISIIIIYIGLGLWKGKNWARITMIILMIIGLISAIIYLSPVTILLSSLIGVYLWFDRSVQRVFKK